MTRPILSNDLCMITRHANDMANDCHAAYWLETRGEEATQLRGTARAHLERLAELFGARLVCDQPADMEREMTRNGRDLGDAIRAAVGDV